MTSWLQRSSLFAGATLGLLSHGGRLLLPLAVCQPQSGALRSHFRELGYTATKSTPYFGATSNIMR